MNHLLRWNVVATAALFAAAGCSRTARADSAYLYGIHWWGYAAGLPVDTGPATMLDCPTHGGWTLETAITHSASWWAPSYFTGLYADLYTNKNMSIITRIDYNWGETVPSPTNPNYAAWPSSVVSAVNTLRHGCHIWIIGNEPNIVGEGTNWPGSQVTPAGYATIYRNVRTAIRNTAQASPAGPHRVLVAPPSPGGVIGGVRWMDGNQWLGQVIDNIPVDEIDGFAIHSYGGSVTDFHNTYASQLALIDNKGLSNRPVYITEWVRAATPGDPASEAASAQFLRDAFADVNTWNHTPGRHNIVCMCWYVYDADNQAGGGWNSYAIEYWKNAGNPPGHSGDLYTAFEQTVDLRYPAGAEGTPAGPPLAEFTGSPRTGTVDFNVNFTDQSSGTVTSWAWTFGDGGTSTAQHPSHTYTTPGTYTVSLTATGPGGSDTETKTAYITANPPPATADFDGDNDVDVGDFLVFQACFNGPGGAIAVSCHEADYDRDDDVDVFDFQIFQLCYNGPSVPPSTNCPI